MKKISILSCDDIESQSNWVKESLCKHTYIPEKLLWQFADENFDFRYFQRKSEALEFLKTIEFKPDIAILDIDFSELPESISSDDRNITAGIELCDIIKKEYPGIIVKMFTGQLGKRPIWQSIRENSNIGKTDVVDKPNEEEKIDKSDALASLEEQIPKLLKEVAKGYFAKLSETDTGIQERLRLLDVINKNSADNNILLSEVLDFGSFTFEISKLLLGYCQICYENNNVKISIIDDKSIDDLLVKFEFIDSKKKPRSECSVAAILLHLLQKTEKIIFTGRWKVENSAERFFLANYLKDPNYQRKKKEIDIKAFNLLLELENIKEQYFVLEKKISNEKDTIKKEQKQKSTIDLMSLPKLKISVGMTKDLNNENWQMFYDKLIGRRILPGWTEINDNDFRFLLCLIANHKVSYNLYSIYCQKTRTTEYHNTYLGLTKYSKNDKFNITEKYILPEEREWLDNYLPLKDKCVDFLENLSGLILNLQSDNPGWNVHIPDFNSLEIFNKFLKRNSEKLNELGIYDSLLYDIQTCKAGIFTELELKLLYV